MSRVFINYRRSDASAHANLLYDWVRERYGEERVFKDVDTIEPGLDFAEAIERAVSASEVMLVLIGKQWIVDANGRRRLDDAEDYVRLEVSTALQRNIRVIPVLVEGATMPVAEELPAPLVTLPRRQAFELSDARSRADRDELLRRLDRILSPRAEAAPIPQQQQQQPAMRPPAPVPAQSAAVPPAATPAAAEKDRAQALVKWGWITAVASIVYPLIAIAPIVLGAMVISRSQGKRTGMGIGIIVTGVVLGFFSLLFWLAASMA